MCSPFCSEWGLVFYLLCITILSKYFSVQQTKAAFVPLLFFNMPKGMMFLTHICEVGIRFGDTEMS